MQHHNFWLFSDDHAWTLHFLPGVAHNFDTFYMSTFGETRVKAGWCGLQGRWVKKRSAAFEFAGGYMIPGWWFGTFFIFHHIWDNPSHWLIFFRGVEPPTRFYHILWRSSWTKVFEKAYQSAFGAQTKHDSDKVMFPSARSVLVASSCIVANFRRPSIF